MRMRARSVTRGPFEKHGESDQQNLIQQMQASWRKKNAAGTQMLLALPTRRKGLSPGRGPSHPLAQPGVELGQLLICRPAKVTLAASAVIALLVFGARLAGLGRRVAVANRQTLGSVCAKSDRIVCLSARVHVVRAAPEHGMGEQHHDG